MGYEMAFSAKWCWVLLHSKHHQIWRCNCTWHPTGLDDVTTNVTIETKNVKYKRRIIGRQDFRPSKGEHLPKSNFTRSHICNLFSWAYHEKKLLRSVFSIARSIKSVCGMLLYLLCSPKINAAYQSTHPNRETHLIQRTPFFKAIETGQTIQLSGQTFFLSCTVLPARWEVF